MPLAIRLKPVETLRFRSDVVAIGTFRCGADDPLFRDSGPCTHHTFVFPRTSTRIKHDGGRPFVGGPNAVSLYNESQRYTREAIDAADASDWYVVADDVLLAAAAEVDPRADERRPFTSAQVPIDSALYFEQRRLFESLDVLEPAFVEETVLHLLGRILRARPVTARDAVEEVRARIAFDPSANIPLRALASSAGVSAFRLCREFRASTGMTITEFKHALRLRTALARLRDGGEDLTTLALDLGYSSHSHFTAAFRRHFGVSPSAVRTSRFELR